MSFRRALALLLAPALLAGCVSTRSTEVGVRTTLLGILEKRGFQQMYGPGSAYLVLPVINAWNVLPTSQQNLIMTSNPTEGDRPVPDDITFKTKDGNNVYIDVNIMWRINPERAADVISRVGHSVEEIKERVIRPVSRATIRDVFNKITGAFFFWYSSHVMDL